MTIANDRDTSIEQIEPQARLLSFLAAIQDIARTHAGAIGVPIFGLDDTAKQVLLDKLNPYVSFELSQNPDIKDMPIQAGGIGMLYILSEDSELLGAEVVSNGDMVTGIIDDACIYPVPTPECLALGDELGMPIVDESLSAVVMLKSAQYKTGLNKSGSYDIEHDLSSFQIGLPLAHYLRFRVQDS